MLNEGDPSITHAQHSHSPPPHTHHSNPLPNRGLVVAVGTSCERKCTHRHVTLSRAAGSGNVNREGRGEW